MIPINGVIAVDAALILEEYEIRWAGKGHFFDKHVMFLWRSRLYGGYEPLTGNLWFVTSEKVAGMDRRAFTVRKMDIRGKIETIGKLYGHKTYASAIIACRKLAATDREE